MKFNLSVLLIVTFYFSSAYSSDTSNGFWLGTFVKKKMTAKYSYWMETQIRYGVDIGATNQVLYRTGVLQKYDNNHGIGYLYGHIQSPSSREHRLTIQHTMKYGRLFDLVDASHRLRLEARSLEGLSFEKSARFRYLVRASHSLNRVKTLVIWDELFVNLNRTDWNGDNDIERNRFFIGIRSQFLDTNNYEVGYLNQFVPRAQGDSTEHTLVLYFFF